MRKLQQMNLFSIVLCPLFVSNFKNEQITGNNCTVKKMQVQETYEMQRHLPTTLPSLEKSPAKVQMLNR
jgi:hypothetical protein